MEQLSNTPSPVYVVSNDVVSNFSPSVQLSTSGLFTLAGSAERAHSRQHRHGSHTISPYTPRMTNPLSPCHRLNSLKSEEEMLTLSSQREKKQPKNKGKGLVKNGQDQTLRLTIPRCDQTVHKPLCKLSS